MPMVAPSMWRESNQPSLQENQGGSPDSNFEGFEFISYRSGSDKPAL